MSIPVRILPRAKTDFREIFTYIEVRSPAGADRWRVAFERELRRVCENPVLFGMAEEDHLTHFQLRQFLFKTKHGLAYRAVFTVIEGEVIILRIRGPGQPPLNSGEMPLT